MIPPNPYIVRVGDSLPFIAQAYTGNPNRWPEILWSNPHLRLAWHTLPDGKRALMFDQSEMKEGKLLFLPLAWPRTPMVRLRPINTAALGMVGDGPDETPVDLGDIDAAPGVANGSKCSPGTLMVNVKPYVYVKPAGQYPYEVPTAFGISSTRWKELRQANADDPDGFVIQNNTDAQGKVVGTCVWAVWEGKKLKIPASWPDPPQGSAMWQLLEATGATPGVQPGTPGTGTPGTGTPGTPGTGQPVGAQPVGAEPATGYKIPTWAYVVGGLVLGTGAVVVAHRLYKKQQTAAAPAHPPSARDTESRVQRARLMPPSAVPTETAYEGA